MRFHHFSLCKVGAQNRPLQSRHDIFRLQLKNGENALAFFTRYYSPIPLLLRGYGAGNSVTAAGIFADILRTLHGGAQ